MEYKRLGNCWLGLADYDLSGKNNTKENYNPITMSLPQWRKFVASGKNSLLLSGGVIPSGTVQTAGDAGGGVIRGNVRQNY